MVGSIALATIAAAAALTSSALPAFVPVAADKNDAVSAEMSSGFVKRECSLETRHFIEHAADSVDEIVTEYNAVADETQAMQVEFVEYSAPVYIIEENKYGVYLDFNDSQGYVVMTDDKVLYALNTTDDLKYLREADELYFSVYDGFMYLDESGDFSSYSEEEDSLSLIGAIDKSAADSNNGTRNTECIILPSKLNDYMTNNYPEYNLSMNVDYLSGDFDYTEQNSTSYYARYYEDTGDYVYGEGNCALNTSYMVLRSWNKKGHVNISASNDIIDISVSTKKDALYKFYGTGTLKETKTINNVERVLVWRCNEPQYLKNMPKLYDDVRSYARNRLLYFNDGFIHYLVPDMLEYVANTKYGNNISVERTRDYVPSRINIVDKKASYLSIEQSNAYGDHGVALLGVREYVKEADLGSLGTKHYLRIYAVADGHSTSLSYYDPNRDGDPVLDYIYLSHKEPTVSRC